MVTPLGTVLGQVGALDLTVVRAWPRGLDHLLLDLRTPADGRLAGQWFADLELARTTAARTAGARQHGRLVLQPGGADHALPALAGLLTEPGSVLAGHRPGRRAVVRRHPPGGTPVFVKVVPPRRQPGLLRSAQLAEQLPLRTPRVMDADSGAGTVTTGPLVGTPLTELLGGLDPEPALSATGAALARLHALPLPAGLRPHDADAELAVTQRWQGWARGYGVTPPAASTPWTRLAPPTPEPQVLVHRDLHDGQLFVEDGLDPVGVQGSGAGRIGVDPVGLLDFDLMAVGDPALDLANLLAHLELREEQGVLRDAAGAAAALLAGYRPAAAVRQALPFYLQLSRARLGYVYGFRSVEVVS